MSEDIRVHKDIEASEWMPVIPWTARLGGATIASSSWVADGVTVDDDEIPTTATTRVKLSGGTDGDRTLVTNRVVTSTGETIDWSFVLRTSNDSIVRRSKDPNSAEIFAVSWPASKVATILTSAFDVPAGMTKLSQSFVGLVCSVKVSGGTAGSTYQIKNTITTADGQTLVYRFDLKVSDQ